METHGGSAVPGGAGGGGGGAGGEGGGGGEGDGGGGGHSIRAILSVRSSRTMRSVTPIRSHAVKALRSRVSRRSSTLHEKLRDRASRSGLAVTSSSHSFWPFIVFHDPPAFGPLFSGLRSPFLAGAFMRLCDSAEGTAAIGCRCCELTLLSLEQRALQFIGGCPQPT